MISVGNPSSLINSWLEEIFHQMKFSVLRIFKRVSINSALNLKYTLEEMTIKIILYSVISSIGKTVSMDTMNAEYDNL